MRDTAREARMKSVTFSYGLLQIDVLVLDDQEEHTL